MLEALQAAYDFIVNNLMASSTVIALVLEFGLRLVKSDKPLSIMHGISAALKGIAMVTSKAAEFLDKVLPQRTTPPAEKK